MKLTISNLLNISFLALIVSDVVTYISGLNRLNFNSTIITGSLSILSLWGLLYYASRVDWKYEIPTRAFGLFSVVIGWNIITILHGAALAKGYWDWKMLVLKIGISLFIPYAIMLGIMFYKNVTIYQSTLRRLFPIAIITLPLSFVGDGSELFSRIVTGIVLFLLFTPYMSRKIRYFVYFIAILSVGAALEYRSNVLRIFFSVGLVFLYYMRKYIRLNLLRVACFVLFITPFILFYLGVSGGFDVFAPVDQDQQQLVLSNQSQSSQSNLAGDSRSFLYVEVLGSMKEHNSFLFGEGAAAKYRSEWFDDMDRYGAEVGFLNILLYSGVIGVMLYFFTLVAASYYAINRSQNFLCKMLGVFVAFRWAFFFIEDIASYDLNFFFLWMAIGLCFSTRFRQMSDAELRQFFKYVTNRHRTRSVPVESLEIVPSV